MAETKPTAKATATAQTKKSGNLISWLAPILCIVAGYIIWRFILGDPSGFTKPDMNGGFWPGHKGPKGAWYRMYEGGIIVPLLIGCFLMVVVFSIERFLTISKATGSGSSSHLAAFPWSGTGNSTSLRSRTGWSSNGSSATSSSKTS
jgi:biopolymer transport protein ExbB